MSDNLDELSLSMKPVTKENWNDFEQLFESKGGPKFCWCTVWRMTNKEKKNDASNCKKMYIYERIMKGIPVGILAYHNDTPIAWCSIAPRDSFHGLNGNENISNVWSITCFYIKREFRSKGIQQYLLMQGIEYARSNSADYIEAYPVINNSPSYRFMGFVSFFDGNGFKFIKMAGSRRHVMNLKVTK